MAIREVQMSLVEDAIREANAKVKSELKGIEQEHMIAMNRERITSESYYDPRVVKFKERRREIAGQVRRWKPSIAQALPKKRLKNGSNTT
jgi:hypothetical protein